MSNTSDQPIRQPPAAVVGWGELTPPPAVAALAPVADAGAAALLAPEAPDIPAGTLIEFPHLAAAKGDFDRRSELLGKGVTQDEVARAHERLVTLSDLHKQHSRIDYIAMAVMQQVATVIAAGIVKGLDELSQAVERRGAALEATVQLLHQMHAGVTNNRCRLYNRSRLAPDALLNVLVKESPGLGKQLPGGKRKRAAAVIEAEVPAVGAKCPFFPPTITAATALTDDELNRLAVWYNDSFNIQAADDVGTRRTRFLCWIQQGV